MTEKNQFPTVENDPIRRLSVLINSPAIQEADEARLEAIAIEQKDEANKKAVAALLLVCASIFCFLLLSMFDFAIKGSILLAGVCMMTSACKNFAGGNFFKGLMGLVFSAGMVGIVVNLL